MVRQSCVLPAAYCNAAEPEHRCKLIVSYFRHLPSISLVGIGLAKKKANDFHKALGTAVRASQEALPCHRRLLWSPRRT